MGFRPEYSNCGQEQGSVGADSLGFRRYRLARGLLIVAAAGVYLDLLGIVATYFVYPGYLDVGEGNVPLVGWRLLHGIPAYASFEDATLVTNLYGPFAYLVHLPAFIAAGARPEAIKISGSIAALAIPMIVFASYRREGLAWSAGTAAAASAAILFNLHTSIWARPDTFLLLLAALAVWAKVATRNDTDPWLASIAIGACGGIAVGLKLFAGLYIAPIALAHCYGRGLRHYVLVGAVGVMVTAAPFLTPLFPIANYLAWFGPMMGKPNPGLFVVDALRFSVFYYVPLLLLTMTRRQECQTDTLRRYLYLGSFYLCFGLVLFLASKPGATWKYFLPFVPIAIDQTVDLLRRAQGSRVVGFALAATAVAVLLFASVPTQKRFLRDLHWEEARGVVAELAQIKRRFPEAKIEIGIGRDVVNIRRTWYRTHLVLAGHPYTIEPAIAMETSFLGIPISPALLKRMSRCDTDVWLFPSGEKPFLVLGYYGNRVFDSKFRDTFYRNHTLEARFRYFDAWICRSSKDG